MSESDADPEGAIDRPFEEGERSPSDQLSDHVDELGAPTHEHLQVGDVAIDLITRQPLVVLDQKATTLTDYYAEEEFDLLTYKQHPWLPVRPDDAVFECAFVGGLEDLHSFSDTYDYPAGRLARVPVELAGGEQ